MDSGNSNAFYKERSNTSPLSGLLSTISLEWTRDTAAWPITTSNKKQISISQREHEIPDREAALYEAASHSVKIFQDTKETQSSEHLSKHFPISWQTSKYNRKIA